MYPSDLDYQTEEAPQIEPIQSQSLLSFLCPLCSERLSVSSDLAGVVGPCPSCSETIRAPRSTARPIVNRRLEVSTSEITLPALDQAWGNQGWGEQQNDAEAERGFDFQGVKKIEAPEQLDDSWLEKVEKGKKQSKRRKRVERLVDNLVESKRGEKIRAIGLAVIGVVLVATIGALYFNNRSGGQLFSKLFGI